jgi:hypothetical protein
MKNNLKNKIKIIVFQIILILIVFILKPKFVFMETNLNELSNEQLTVEKITKVKMLYWEKFFDKGNELVSRDEDSIEKLLNYLKTIRVNPYILDIKKDYQDSEALTIKLYSSNNEILRIFINGDKNSVSISIEDEYYSLYRVNNNGIDMDMLRNFFSEESEKDSQ